MKILNRWTDVILWEGKAGTVAEAVYSALRAGADLRDANLRDANLRDANLRGANLTPIRDDIWAVLSGAPAEVPALLAKLRAGEIDGSCYEGACACLVGTLANARHCDYRTITTIAANGSRPAERFFVAIKIGDTPETSQFAKLAAEWIEDWLVLMQAAFGPVVASAA